MTFNPLPPQAYTKETLLKAYQWLMGQNSSLKEIATTPDILVSLYLKATRDGDHSLERPSIQNFKNELRSLAGMMGELDRPANSGGTSMNFVSSAPAPTPTPAPVQAPCAPNLVHAHVQAAAAAVAPVAAPTYTPPAPQVPPPTPVQVQMPLPGAMESAHAYHPVKQVSYTEKTLTTTTNSQGLVSDLDASTRTMIQEVKEEFNLSSDLEALRMLVKIGYARSKGLLR